MQKLKRATKGQSLVETAIIVPILIFMMIGVFEVGWALRGYLVLVNVNRETTRFAVRPGYLDFSEKDAATVGYSSVLSQANASLGTGDSQQLPLDFQSNSVLIISHLVIDTGLPCDPDITDPADCICDDFVADNTNFDEANSDQNFTYDDLILTPDTPGYEFYLQTYPTNTLSLSQTTFLTITSQVDYAKEVNRLAQQNNKFNCELLKKGGVPSANNIIITELLYEQPQLFGFPLISNPFTDPVPLYTRTSMRIVAASRSGSNVDTVGPVCEVYPWYISSSDLGTPNEGDAIPNSISGWIKWNSNPILFGSPVAEDAYMEYQLENSRMAINDYQEDGSDSNIAVGKKVDTYASVTLPSNADELIGKLANREIIIPVLDGSDTIVDFIEITVSTDGLNANGKQIPAIYVGSVAGVNCLDP